jgi:hypothetical protein
MNFCPIAMPGGTTTLKIRGSDSDGQMRMLCPGGTDAGTSMSMVAKFAWEAGVSKSKY